MWGKMSSGVGLRINMALSQVEIVNGSEGDDIITAEGVTIPVTIRGKGGNDTLTGGLGNDIILGGTGADTLSGGAGNDTLYSKEYLDFSDSAIDALSGGEGNDRLYFDEADASSLTTTIVNGGAGIDSAFAVTFSGSIKLDMTAAQLENVTGSRVDDEITAMGSMAPVSIDGNTGNDILTGGAGDDLLSGNGGADRIFGGDGDDTISGGSGKDVLHGGAGVDVLWGGSLGNQVVNSASGERDWVFHGADGGTSTGNFVVQDRAYSISQASTGAVVGSVVPAAPGTGESAYEVVGGNLNGAFAINATTGEITITNPALVRDHALHILDVRVRNLGTPELSDVVHVTVNYIGEIVCAMLDLDATSDSGISSTDNITDDTTPTFTGLGIAHDLTLQRTFVVYPGAQRGSWSMG